MKINRLLREFNKDNANSFQPRNDDNNILPRPKERVVFKTLRVQLRCF